jgi:copper(I)-binding protein
MDLKSGFGWRFRLPFAGLRDRRVFMQRSPLIALILLGAILLSACGAAGSPKIEITDAWVRAASMSQGAALSGAVVQPIALHTMGGAVTAGYMTIKNSGVSSDNLIAAQSDVVGTTELSLSHMKDGAMQMIPQEKIEVPAGGQVKLGPDGYYLMMIGLKRDLAVGDKVNLTLTFEKSGQIKVVAEVRNP